MHKHKLRMLRKCLQDLLVITNGHVEDAEIERLWMDYGDHDAPTMEELSALIRKECHFYLSDSFCESL